MRVNSITPNTGGSAASTTVQINGSGFVSGATLTLGGRGTAVTFVSSTRLSALAEPHAPGAVDVIITNPNGERSQLTNGFTYVDRPTTLVVDGNTSLLAIGDSSQLTVTVLFVDGRTQDVTRECAWFSSFPAVVAASTDGVLTARSLGTSQILVRYPSTNSYLSRLVDVTVTPPGTTAASGRAREPGAGGIAGVTVTHQRSGQSTHTDASGYFSFGGLGGPSPFSFSKDGFEDTEAEPAPGGFFDVPMQRSVRIEAGGPPFTSSLAPNDMDYVIAGTHCQPCRMIRIVSQTSGTITVTLRWTAPVSLHIWSQEGSIDAAGPAPELVTDLQVRGGETIIFVGTVRPDSVGDYIPFALSVGASLDGPSHAASRLLSPEQVSAGPLPATDGMFKGRSTTRRERCTVWRAADVISSIGERRSPCPADGSSSFWVRLQLPAAVPRAAVPRVRAVAGRLSFSG
jgi:hypothetical protein